MCHINILIRAKTNKNEEVCSFLQTITARSYDSNSDGDGVFYSGTQKVYKSEKKLSMVNHLEDIKKSQIIISHQRLATSGKEEKYTHPFESEEFVMVHNGVVSQKASQGHSDTHNMFEEFLQTYKDSKETKREDMVIDAIKKCGKEWDSGSYSIALYDKVNNFMYYFRNSCTINCYETGEYSFITTSSSNDKYLSLISDETFNSYNLDTYKIYKYWTKKDSWVWSLMGEIEHQPPKQSSWGGYKFNRYAPTEEDEDSYLVNDLGTCYFCNKHTSRVSVYNQQYICKNCSKGYMGMLEYE